jgi:integrase
LTKAGKPTARHGMGLRWQVKYQVDGAEVDGGSFSNKTLARNKLVELESSVQRGAWVDPTDTTTITEWMRIHAATLSHAPGTAARLRIAIDKHVAPTPFGSRRLNKVRPSEAQAWATDRAKVLAPSTLALVVGYVRTAFRAARADMLMGRDPFEQVTMTRGSRERIVPLTSEQVDAISKAIRPQYRAMVLAQAGLGLRIAEVLALRTQDIDFLRRTVRVQYQVDRDTYELVAPKTSRSRRTLPLPSVVGNVLSESIREYRPSPAGLLFHTSTNRPYSQAQYRDANFAAAVRAVRETDPTLPVKTTPHDLRHHYASVLLAAGESVIAVAELLGHEDATLVLKVYGHLLPGREDHTRRAIDAAFAPKDDGPAQLHTAHRLPE